MAWPEKLPSGRYRGVYRDAFGKSRSAGTFAHKAAAVRAANAKEAEVRKSLTRNADAHKQTWGEWCDTWWMSRTVENSTLKRDASRRDHHLKPRWEDVPLGQITRFDIKRWAADLKRTGLSNSTVQRIVHLFSASLVAAVDAEILVANPAARLKLPSSPPSRDRFLEHVEYDAIIDQQATAQDQLIQHVLTYAGLRIGELSALRKHRIRTARGKGSIAVAESFDDETSEFKPYPKGKRKRNIPIDDWLCELLEEQTAGLGPNELVFTTGSGTVVRRSNWDNVFRAAVAAVNLGDDERPVRVEDVTIHTLRHTFCSWLVQEGVSLAKVGELAGHRSPLTTQRYAHLQPTDDSEVHTALGRPRAASAPRLPHGDLLAGEVHQQSARSDMVGPVGLEPTTRGLKERSQSQDES